MQEDKWFDFEDDEIEVTLELSEYIFEALLNDTIASYVDIRQKTNKGQLRAISYLHG